MKMAMVKDLELFLLLERHGPALIKHKFQVRVRVKVRVRVQVRVGYP